MSEIILSEEWRAVVGYEGRYEVSNLGQVRSVARIGLHPNRHKNKQSNRKWKSTILKASLRAGYPSVSLFINGKLRSCQVHQLVLAAFIGPCPAEMECRHFPDRDKTNNRLDNLQWGTPAQNAHDKEMHGQTSRGEANGNAILTAELVAAIRNSYRPRKIGLKMLSRIYGVHFTTIHQIVSGKTWKEATK